MSPRILPSYVHPHYRQRLCSKNVTLQSFANSGCDDRQDFFYHVLLALDSYTFNSHLKTELVAEIARLYYQQTTSKSRGVSLVHHKDGASGANDDSNSTAGERVRGFTGTMVKLKVWQDLHYVRVSLVSPVASDSSHVLPATLS